MLRAALSCLLDDVPQIWRSVVPWLATVTMLARVHPSHIYIHHVCPLPHWMAELCGRVGVAARRVNPFNLANPYANKIRQCATDFGEAESVVLSDVDLAFAKPLPLEPLRGLIAGKPVDYPNPPLETLRTVFGKAGIAPTGMMGNGYLSGDIEVTFETIAGNFNGGLYVVPRTDLLALGEAWARWARWLGARSEILGEWTRYLDQVSFCLAVNELRLPLQTLDDRWNYPMHIAARPASEQPFVFHHHALLDENHHLHPILNPDAQAAMRAVNRAIEEFRQAHWSILGDEAALG